MEAHPDPASLANHPLLWRGRQITHRIRTLATGHPCLDAALPGNGWPQGAVTELVHGTAGCGELSLLLPALATLSQHDRWVAMVDPPWIPCPSALHGHGLVLDKLLLIRTQNRRESLFACEQAVRGLAGGALLAWPDELSFAELRRLQLAANDTQQTVFLFRGEAAVGNPSPAVLRLQLAPDGADLRIGVLKCRGQRPAADIRIRQSHLRGF